MVPAFELEEIVREARSRTDVPGVAAGLFVDGTITTAADGVLQLGSDEPVQPDTPFRIASISKPFTASLALSAIPDEPSLHAWLSHTSGLRSEHASPLPPEAWGLFSYSNAGYWLAGDLAAHTLGTTFEKAMQQCVLAPLGLVATGYDEPPAPARGHVQQGETGHRAVRADAYPVARRPSGGLWSTVGDLLAFAAAQMQAPSPAFEPQVEALGARYALGWWVRKRADGATVVDHEGSVAGYQSLLLLVPEEQLALAVLTNSWRGSGLARHVVTQLGLLPGHKSVQASGDVVPADIAGTYALDGTEAVVEPRGDGLDVTEMETDPVTGVSRSLRYRAASVGGGVYGFAGGVLMSHRLDFPRPGFARIGWVVMPRVVA